MQNHFFFSFALQFLSVIVLTGKKPIYFFCTFGSIKAKRELLVTKTVVAGNNNENNISNICNAIATYLTRHILCHNNEFLIFGRHAMASTQENR